MHLASLLLVFDQLATLSPAVGSTTNPREPVRNFVCKAYRVFRKMLESGHPPDDWSKLLAEARAEGKRLQRQVLVLDA